MIDPETGELLDLRTREGRKRQKELDEQYLLPEDVRQEMMGQRDAEQDKFEKLRLKENLIRGGVISWPQLPEGIIELDTDEALDPVLEALWDKGYMTFGSCAGGHPGHARRGHIQFEDPLTEQQQTEAASILRRHGLTVLDDDPKVITFRPLGGGSRGRRDRFRYRYK